MRTLNSLSAAVSHSRSRRRVTSRRTSVRTTASSDSSIWCGRNDSVKNMLALARQQRGASVLDDLRFLFHRSPHQVEQELEPGRHKQNAECGQRPVQRVSRKHQPAEDQQQESCRFHQAAAQIVQNLPLRNQRDGIRDLAPRLIRHARQQPARDLPVSAQPAVFAPVVGVVVRGIILDDLDVTWPGRRARTRLRSGHD